MTGIFIISPNCSEMTKNLTSTLQSMLTHCQLLLPGKHKEKGWCQAATILHYEVKFMTEEEKIFAGKLFDARTKELRDMKHKAHVLCQKFNLLDEYDEQRLPLIREFIGSIGKKYYFQGPIQFNYGCHTYIGENFFANFNMMVMDDGRIFIGDNVMFGPNVSLMATLHPLIPEERIAMKYPDGHVSMSEYAKDIHIGNNVWLACNVVVLAGVTIGDNAVIGAGSVVTKDIPANYIAYGNPCKPVRLIAAKDSKLDLL